MTSNAYLGGGCFWCLEVIFKELLGVSAVTSGYMGGESTHPTYDQVCSGRSGHVEVVEIVYDPQQIKYETLLSVFFSIHDPTTMDRQGNDVGSQYRSVIYCEKSQDVRDAKSKINSLQSEKLFIDPIVTKVLTMKPFYPAEEYHMNYFANNSLQPYCQAVISPKLGNFRHHWKSFLRHSK